MSICCLFVIIFILLIGITIVYVINVIYTKLYNTIKNIHKLKKENNNNDNNDDVDENKNIAEIQTIAATEPELDILTFFVQSNNPAVCLCNKKCTYLDICNLNICEHLTSKIKIQHDKNTLKNVIYIHIYECIIIYITKNENVCSKEQEMSLEDVNYINAYISKYPELSVFIVMYMKDSRVFVDYSGRERSEYSIDVKNTETIRELLQIQKIPSAPLLQTNTENHGSFFYIAKQ